MINAAIVGANLKTAMYAAPHVDQQFGQGQGAQFVQLVMKSLAGMGVPGAEGLAPKTKVLGGDDLAHQPSSQTFAGAVQDISWSNSR